MHDAQVHVYLKLGSTIQYLTERCRLMHLTGQKPIYFTIKSNHALFIQHISDVERNVMCFTGETNTHKKTMKMKAEILSRPMCSPEVWKSRETSDTALLLNIWK